MGLLSSLASGVGTFISGAIGVVSSIFSSGSSSGGSSSSSTSHTETVYKPDDLKIEILKNERVSLEKNMNLAIIEAKAKGMVLTAQSISMLYKNLDSFMNDSLKIVEGSSFEIVKEIESFYDNMQERVNKLDFEYHEKKFPMLINQCEKIDQNSKLYKLFENRIDQDLASHYSQINKLIDNLNERRNMVLSSHLSAKEKLLENTAILKKEFNFKNYSSSFTIESLEEKPDFSSKKLEYNN